MKVELPRLLPGLLPEKVLDVAARMPKTVLRERAASKKGDKARIDADIPSAWVTTLRHDTCGVPPYDGDAPVREILVLVCRVSGDQQHLPRLREMLHGAIPNHLLLLMESSSALYLSALPKGALLSQLVRAELSSPHPDFARDMSSAVALKNLKEVFDRWLCALYALHLSSHGPKMSPLLPYRPTSSPEEAAALKHSLSSLDDRWRKANAVLKQKRSPQERINASRTRRVAADEIKALLSKYQLIP